MASSTWPGWQHLFLHAAGLPVSPANVNFLRLWSLYEHPTCDRNPIELSHRAAGSSRCKRLPNGKYARNYADRQDAAQAFAGELTKAAFPDLHAALMLGDPQTYHDQAGIVADLGKWGSVLWQRQYAQFEAVTAAGTGTTGTASAGHTKDVSRAWHTLMRTLAVDGHKTITELRKSTAALTRIERRLRRA